MQVILASASPRRKQLLSEIISEFEIIPAVGKEVVNANLTPEKIASSLAEQKCEEVFLKHPEALVIGCDTIVVYNGKILGKPKDEKDAENTLLNLSGNTHQVITGLCVKTAKNKIVTYAETLVNFNILSTQFIKDYVKSGSPMDKAGSYGIQDGGLVKSFVGSYSNVVGLPIELLKETLIKIKEKND
ncbi:MAG: septum formation protein Maf [Clostridia bacterium]|nr:septum formation protein Maf [Clostridia bacterium]